MLLLDCISDILPMQNRSLLTQISGLYVLTLVDVTIFRNVDNNKEVI